MEPEKRIDGEEKIEIASTFTPLSDDMETIEIWAPSPNGVWFPFFIYNIGSLRNANAQPLVNIRYMGHKSALNEVPSGLDEAIRQEDMRSHFLKVVTGGNPTLGNERVTVTETLCPATGHSKD